MAAWKLFGHDVTTEQLPAELRSILAQMQRERVAFEALTNGARESAQNLAQLSQPLTEAQKTVAELQARVKSLERLVPVLATLDEQTEGVSKAQRRTETQLAHTSDDAKRLRTEIEELRGTLEQALALKNDLTGFLELGGGFKALRLDANNLGAQLREITQGFDRARERQEELRRVTDAAAARLGTFEEREQQVQSGVAAAETRAAALERTVAQVAEVASDAAQTKRQLGTLKALADYVGQKVSTLEQQREAVDRATGQAARLHDLMREIDAKIKQHEESAKGLGELETRVGELRAVHAEVLERSEEISAHHEEVKQADQELRGRLGALRDEVQRTVKRFELESQGLDAVGQRILDLRGALTDMETRFRTLDESSRGIADVRSRADGLATQLEGISENVGQLETQAERVRAVQANTEQLGQTVEDMTQRVARLEKAQPNVEAVLQDVASLKGTHEAVKDAIEQLRAGEMDMARVREAQAGTKAWLASATESVSALRGELAAVEEMEPAERRMSEVDAAVTTLESRAQNLEGLAERTRALGQEVEQRQAALEKATEHLEHASRVREEAAAVAQQLEDRTTQLTGALATGASRATELQATLDELDGRAGSLRFAQKRMAQFEERLAKWESTELQLTRALEQMTQRQATLDALEADMHRLFEVAERTVDDVRSIAAAKEEVTQ